MSDKIKLSKEDIEYMRAVQLIKDDTYRWFTRDSDNMLIAWTVEPVKGKWFWRPPEYNDNYVFNCDHRHKLQFIKWEDEKPFYFEVSDYDEF